MTWELAWREGRTHWDAGDSPPILKELVRRDELPTGSALVPGCGSGYDVLTLATERRSVTGIDGAPTAVERFETLRRERDIDPARARAIVGNFFDADLGPPFDLVWDYTFLCTFPREERPRWAERTHQLLAEKGELVTLLFPVLGEEAPYDRGPPYNLDPADLTELLAPWFERTSFQRVERSHPGREGKEWLARWRKVT